MIAHLLFIAITFNSLHINKAEREPAQPSHVWAGCMLSGLPWEALCPQHRPGCLDPALDCTRPSCFKKWLKSIGPIMPNIPTDSPLFLLTWVQKQGGLSCQRDWVRISAVLFTSRRLWTSDDLRLSFFICKVRLLLPTSKPCNND